VRFANLNGNVVHIGVMELRLDSSGPGASWPILLLHLLLFGPVERSCVVMASTGVLLGGGTWNQSGTLQISSSTATGTPTSLAGIYNRSPCFVRLSNTASSHQGVSLVGGTWQQYGRFTFVGQNATGAQHASDH
jgi:hypothetical protein